MVGVMCGKQDGSHILCCIASTHSLPANQSVSLITAFTISHHKLVQLCLKGHLAVISRQLPPLIPAAGRYWVVLCLLPHLLQSDLHCLLKLSCSANHSIRAVNTMETLGCVSPRLSAPFCLRVISSRSLPPSAILSLCATQQSTNTCLLALSLIFTSDTIVTS